MLSIVKHYARVLCIRKRDWQEQFSFSLTIHTEVQLSYAVLRLPRNKCKFLQINTKKKNKENTKLSTKHTKYLFNASLEASNTRFF